MAESSDVRDALSAAAQKAKRRTAFNIGQVEQHPLKEMIEADRYLCSQSAASSARRGLVINRIRPGGSLPGAS